MAIVSEISWDDMLDGKPLPENPARAAWREAVSKVAERAKAALPEAVNVRIEKAVAIVLAGDVELMADGKAKVASQSNGTTEYFVVNGSCNCPDFPKAPQGFCKHRLSAAIARRASALATQQLGQLDHASHGTSQPPPESPQGSPQGQAISALPEAPASANCHVMLAGRQVQVTLRDTDEQRLLARLEALLKRFPVEDEPEQEPSEGWCSTHGVQMKLRNGAHGSWWSHKTPQGWCKGK